MSRLPNVGGDDNTWGTILNDFLGVEHNADGSQKTLDVTKGGTGATDAATARTNLGAVFSSDSRLTDTRTPSDSSVTDAKISGTLSQSKITNLSSDLASKVAKGELVFNILDYGAVGDGSTNDQPGFQAAANAAIAVAGILFIPPPPVGYRLGDTVTLQPSSGISFQLSIFGAMADSAIIPSWNTSGKPVFKSLGWKRGTVSGLGIKSSLSSGTANNTVIFDIDADGTYTSSGQLLFQNCRFNFAGTGTGHIGVRLGHSSVGRDISIITFDTCKFNGASQLGTKNEVGCSVEGQNTLNIVWSNCDFTNLLKGITNIPSTGAADTLGGGSIFVKDSGGEYCATQFEYARKGDPFAVSGGRYEHGTTFFKLLNSADPTLGVSVSVRDTNISAFTADIQFDIQGACSLQLDNVYTDDSGAGRGSAYNAGFVTFNPGSSSAYSSLMLRGGMHYGTAPMYTVTSGDLTAIIAPGPVLTDSNQKTTGRYS